MVSSVPPSTGYVSTAGLSLSSPLFQYQTPLFPSQSAPWTGSAASNVFSTGAGAYTLGSGYPSSGPGLIMSHGVSAAQTPTGNFHHAPSPGGGLSKVQIQKIKPPVFNVEICLEEKMERIDITWKQFRM